MTYTTIKTVIVILFLVCGVPFVFLNFITFKMPAEWIECPAWYRYGFVITLIGTFFFGITGAIVFLTHHLCWH